ncbi:RHH-type proline utilization regulon transcriptional repressor/proline dehydrogenase/delta 1-pyrroline-5-carboxylate dehydrogenase [Desulfosalsimonas propionicica]|uniref:L-glutamate gamma-semialdehyde dehydrogenase n=1 Tax=Desulfosalsimonas propionicica TaxID=332175 RepID=A0A7W0C8G3_9BACT|nr:proline dehydrogenase family protein [Desulfosalsimonas propionicica]MBA2881098.1 RHH-type proline utilization regulon transcriptional repressor/proline dehydrogenase/delta 1-pyrroline-5-carboxylate dehydrogenase [Desulfosalsimonas propionicica]
MNTPNPDQIEQSAAALAAKWQNRANELLTTEEKHIQQQMKRLLTHPLDKVVLTRMIDQCFRSHDHERVADQVNHLLSEYGVPDFFSRVERLLIQMFMGMGRHFPNIAVPRMVEQMRNSSSRAIIPGESKPLHRHLEKRRAQGVRMNINHLGEAVLGEEEALRRLQTYIEDMRDPDVEYISVKISTLYSQISPMAFEHTVALLVERLSQLLRVAKENYFTRENGEVVPKIVNMDMEEYRDIHITYEAFVRTLEKEEFRDYSAGIVLQAYLPDAYLMQQRLTQWAVRRVKAGGAVIKLRIVKGANLEMELLESSHFNWPLATYDNKMDVDANYKRMVYYAMQPEHIRAVHLGVASHNLFELAYAHELGHALGVTEFFWFEMLEGMADHMRRTLQESVRDILLYAPVASKDQFINAIAYLIRRLDENTSPENFLRYAPYLTTNSHAWTFLKDQFEQSCRRMEAAPASPSRIQDRNTETFDEKTGAFFTNRFTNEPDTDWSLPPNQKWAEAIRDKWRKSADDDPIEIPVVIDGDEIFQDRETRNVIDVTTYNPDSGDAVTTAVYRLAGTEDIRCAVETARRDPDGWRDKTHEQRHQILDRVCHELRKARGDLIGAAAANWGKMFAESDPEVSEAIDFTEFYPHSAKIFHKMDNVRVRPRGVGLVITPWNFPIAIPCGGIAASLAAGNTVLFKPASAAVLTAWELVQCFYRAGVSKKTLQFIPCAGSTAGSELTGNPEVDYIILTGGTDTGLRILKNRPDIQLAAETGGKNATIVTAMSDRDQAIKNIVHSAYSNSGQKCSATSLVILEKEVYDDQLFRRQLADAAKSCKTGSCWAFQNKVGAIIAPPDGDLHRALTQLEEGESWALKPEPVAANPYIWSPGIKWGVQPGGYTHMTEFFGPVIGVMRAQNLDHAIDLVNMTGYGLTSGLESLDRREQEKWKAGIKAGNLYINKGTTGAIVLRQPFGGMGKSALGAGIKAGSPNYVYQFMAFAETGYPAVGDISEDSHLLRIVNEWQIDLRWNRFDADLARDLEKVVYAVKSYLYWWEQEFGQEHDYFHLRGQDNHLRYLPRGRVVVRVSEKDSVFELLARIAAARITGCTATVSIPSGLSNIVTAFLDSHHGRRFFRNGEIVEQTDERLCEIMGEIDRIRYAAADRVPPMVYERAAETGFYVSRTPVYMEGRLELLQYLQEQAVSNNYHRYGNLGERGLI